MPRPLKLYKPGQDNWSDPTILYRDAKKYLEQGTKLNFQHISLVKEKLNLTIATSSFLEEYLEEVTNYMEKIREVN